jgi:hypothetical protein
MGTLLQSGNIPAACATEHEATAPELIEPSGQHPSCAANGAVTSGAQSFAQPVVSIASNSSQFVGSAVQSLKQA